MITALLLLLPALAQDGDPAPSEAPAAETTEAAEAPEVPEAPETEAEPAAPEAKEAPTTEEAPPTEEAPASEQPPAAEEAAATEETPATEAEPAAEPETAAPEPEPPNPLAIETSEFETASAAAASIAEGDYETLEGLSRRQVRWLKPKRARLPANARNSTDFTAYVLEWGEAELGPTGLSVGVLPRVQIGTVPLLDALGLYNGWAKVNPLRLGGFDLSVNGSAFYLPIKGFTASVFSVGALGSLQILEPWSVHFGGNYAVAKAQGVPDVTNLSPLLTPIIGEELADYSLQLLKDDLVIDASAQIATVRLATDYRLNARDSIVAQAQAMVWASVDTDIDLPPILNMNESLDVNSEGTLRLRDAYIASIAYQAAWRRLTVRAGFGISSQPGAWLIQSVKLNYRFGGETRRDQRQLRDEWRGNKEDKTKKTERKAADDRGVWTPDQDNETPPEDQGDDTGEE